MRYMYKYTILEYIGIFCVTPETHAHTYTPSNRTNTALQRPPLLGSLGSDERPQPTVPNAQNAPQQTMAPEVEA